MTIRTRTPPADGPTAAEVIRRLRAWSAPSWNHGDRLLQARRACQTLADLTVEHEGSPARTVPDHGWSALADQLAVLADDARSAGVPEERVDRVLRALASGLGGRG
jgi:hypothetical protein